MKATIYMSEAVFNIRLNNQRNDLDKTKTPEVDQHLDYMVITSIGAQNIS